MAFMRAAAAAAVFGSIAYALPQGQTTTSAYECNPAHAYPAGQTCIPNTSAGSGYVLSSVPATTAAASTSAYECNPAHAYPTGQTCVPNTAAGSGYVLSTVPVTTAAASTSVDQCNPAHAYPTGQTCVPNTAGTGYMISSVPATTAAASTSAYVCNPAHEYPAGQTCVASGSGYVLSSVAAPSTSAYACNPAHQYPAGQTCVASGTGYFLSTVPASTPAPTPAAAAANAGTVTVYSTVVSTISACSADYASKPAPQGSATAPAPAASSGASKCPLDLVAGTYEYAHLLEINGVNGYNGKVDSSSNTSMTFDIPAADAGKTCSTYFLLPTPGTMETSDYTLTTTDSAKISVASGGNVLTQFVPTQYQKTLVEAKACPAGGQLQYNMYTQDSLSLTWFQDYNPCAVGMFVVVS